MKKISWIFVLLLNVIMTLGQITVQQNGGQTNNHAVLREKSASGRPKAPARYNVECTYILGYMEFTFPSEVSYMSVEIYEGETLIWNGFVTLDSPAIEIPILCGEHNVICTTDNGAEYGGIVCFSDEK